MLRFAKPVKIVKDKKPLRRFKPARAAVPAIKTLDHIARDLCRTRGSCEAAGYTDEIGGMRVECKGYLQWAHVVSRKYHRVRWRPEGCLYLCAAHHLYWTHNGVEWRWFLKWKLGEEALRAFEHRAVLDPKVDRAATLESLRLTHSLLKARGEVWSNPLVIH